MNSAIWEKWSHVKTCPCTLNFTRRQFYHCWCSWAPDVGGQLTVPSKPLCSQAAIGLAASWKSLTLSVTHRCNAPLARNHYHSSPLLTTAVPAIWITSFINQHDPVTCQERNNMGYKSRSGGERHLLSKQSIEGNRTSIEDLGFIDSSYHRGLSILSIYLHQATKVVQAAVDLPAHPEIVDVVFCFALLHSHVKPAAGRGQKRQPVGLQRTLRAVGTSDLGAIQGSTNRGSLFCSLTQILSSPWPTVQPQACRVLCCTSYGSGAPVSSAGLSPSATHCSHHQSHHSSSLLTARPLLQPGPWRPAARQRYGKVVTSCIQATENTEDSLCKALVSAPCKLTSGSWSQWLATSSVLTAKRRSWNLETTHSSQVTLNLNLLCSQR